MAYFSSGPFPCRQTPAPLLFCLNPTAWVFEELSRLLPATRTVTLQFCHPLGPVFFGRGDFPPAPSVRFGPLSLWALIVVLRCVLALPWRLPCPPGRRLARSGAGRAPRQLVPGAGWWGVWRRGFPSPLVGLAPQQTKHTNATCSLVDGPGAVAAPPQVRASALPVG